MELRRGRHAERSYEYARENAQTISELRESKRRIEEAVETLNQEDNPNLHRDSEDQWWTEVKKDQETIALLYSSDDGIKLFKQDHFYPFKRTEIWLVDIIADAYDLFPDNCIGHRCYVAIEDVDRSSLGVRPQIVDVRTLEDEIYINFTELFAPKS